MDNFPLHLHDSEYVAFVEPASSTEPRRVVLTVKLPAHRAREVQALCANNGWHALRFYREAFAAGLRDMCQKDAQRHTAGHADARSAAAGPSESTLVQRWREIEAQSPDAPCGSEDRFGF